MKILWFETTDSYTVSRAIEAGKALGIEVGHADAYDIDFIADGSEIGVFAHGKNVVNYYDMLVVRSFMPSVSNALTLAQLFHREGKIVFDTSIVDEGYAMSKMNDYVMMAAGGVAVPRTRQFADANKAAAFAAQLGYPCIVKGANGSQGKHVHKIGNETELRKKLMSYPVGEAMVQEYLDAPVDYRVIVIGYRALPVYVSRQPRAGDFRTNFEYNELVTALPMEDAPELKHLAEAAAQAMRREFSGVDIRCRNGVPLVLEANRRPGFKDFERATGYDVATTFLRYAMEKFYASKQKTA